jgi:Lhr-like helicase
MNNIKKVAVWMDHSHAIVMELTSGPILQHRIESDFNYEIKEASIRKGESLMHNKEQHEQSAFYKQITKAIIEANKVLLFGPTEAKDELLNLLKVNTMFDKIQIEVKHSDVMTENQMHAYVREYFV